MKRDESMQDYVGIMMVLHRKLSNAGYAFTDREVALVMLMGLPDTYGPLILNLEQDEQILTTKAVKTRLLIKEKRRLRRDEDRLSDEESPTRAALITKARLTTESKQPNEKVHHQLTVKKDEKFRQCTSNHMTSHEAKVTDFNPSESRVETANRESISVMGKGRVQIQLSDECGGSFITLEDVLYVTDLNGNLLSVERIEERGLHVTFAGGKAEVTKDTGELTLTATREGTTLSKKR
ncbi:hypothetical protein HPB49_001828 [Dermacentor silvarum]|uniref:Uncharacterized protein n=1 Tax=Dermacentor silvarum TaxID=543639 RepID=A0ACB8D213_DERSI|nr:hypothetical protein HPB49_001828 [Dermacentor silvarum]